MAGDLVLMQYAREGVVRAAKPVRVVEDSPERVILYLAAGTEVGRRSLQTQFRSYSRVWEETNVLMITPVHAVHSLWAMWFADSWEFHCWYVNLQEPIRRSERGFLSCDHSLDVVIFPDGAWRWKDEEETELAIERGVLTREVVELGRVEGEEVLRQWRAGEGPFGEAWPEWRPDPSWSIPLLPSDWARLE